MQIGQAAASARSARWVGRNENLSAGTYFCEVRERGRLERLRAISGHKKAGKSMPAFYKP